MRRLALVAIVIACLAATAGHGALRRVSTTPVQAASLDRTNRLYQRSAKLLIPTAEEFNALALIWPAEPYKPSGWGGPGTDTHAIAWFVSFHLTNGNARMDVRVFRTEAAAKAYFTAACPVPRACKFTGPYSHKHSFIDSRPRFVHTYAHCRNLEIEVAREANYFRKIRLMNGNSLVINASFAKAVKLGMSPVSAGRYPCKVPIP